MTFQVLQRLPPHLALEISINALIRLTHEFELLHQRQCFLQTAHTVYDALLERFGSLPSTSALFSSHSCRKGKSYLVSPRLKHQCPIRLRTTFLSENRAHGRFERDTQLDLVETEVSARGIHDAVIMMHGQHKGTREAMAIDQSNRRHRIAIPLRQQLLILAYFLCCGRYINSLRHRA